MADLSSIEKVAFIGIAAGVLTAGSMLPQVIKTFREKTASEVSLVMIFVLMGGIGLWVWYGYLKNDLPILITNSFSMAINLVMIILRIRYRNNKSS